MAVCARQAYVVITLSRGDASAAASAAAAACPLSAKLSLPDLAMLSLCTTAAFLLATGLLYFSAAKRWAAAGERGGAAGRGGPGSPGAARTCARNRALASPLLPLSLSSLTLLICI